MKKSTVFIFILMLVVLTVALSSCFLLDFFNGGYEKATKIVVKKVLPQQLALTPNATYICSRLESPIASGTIITPNKVKMSGSNESSIIIRDWIVAKEESYFFLLDLNPGAFYAHPVKYILVSKSGSTTVISAEWLPKINGKIPSELIQAIPSTDLIIKSNITLYKPIGIHLTYDFPQLTLRESEGVIIVQGLKSNENLFSYTQDAYMDVMGFFKAYKNARPYNTVDINGLVQSDAANVLSAIDAMANKHSLVTIYIIAHGNVDYVRLGGHGFSAYQFKNKMAAHPNTKFIFLLGSCHGGSFINDLSSLSNVQLVMTAAKSNESAWPDWDKYGSTNDYNPSDVGTEWTSSVFSRAKSIVESATNWAAVRSYAISRKISTTSAILYQAHWGSLGLNSTYGFYYNLDLCSRVNKESPQLYKSW